MSNSSSFIESLLEIPYFASLAEENGIAWLTEIFQELGISEYDFGFMTAAVESLPAQELVTVDDVVEAIGDAVEASATPPVSAAAASARKSGPAEDDSAVRAEAQGNGNGNDDEHLRTLEQEIKRVYETIGRNGMDSGRYFSILLAALTNIILEHSDSGGNLSEFIIDGVDHNIQMNGGDDRVYLPKTNQYTVSATVTKVDGGSGTDTLYLYQDAKHFGDDKEVGTAGFTVNLAGTSDFGANGGQVTFKNVENVVGSKFNDTVTGNDDDNTLVGRDGDDTLNGGAGDDTLQGDAGNDKLNGGDGVDTLLGGDGNDTMNGDAGADTLTGGAGNDTMNGGTDDDTLNGEAGNDVLNGGDGNDKLTGGDGDDVFNGGAGIDTIKGDAGADTINAGDGDDIAEGGDANDVINGDAGNDNLSGGLGDDTVKGGAGNDTIKGDAGADKITGGAGVDTITGGDGADLFIYTLFGDSGAGAGNRDLIMDFNAAADIFDFSALPTASDGSSATLTFLGTQAFSNTKGEVRFVQQDFDGTANDVTIVQIDKNGDGTADFEIEIKGLHTLTSSNFDLS